MGWSMIFQEAGLAIALTCNLEGGIHAYHI